MSENEKKPFTVRLPVGLIAEIRVEVTRLQTTDTAAVTDMFLTVGLKWLREQLSPEERLKEQRSPAPTSPRSD